MTLRSITDVQGLFVGLTKRYFAGIAAQHGMGLGEQIGAITLRYENQAVRLSIGLDAVRSFEFVVVVRRLGEVDKSQKRPFTLGEILRSQYAEDAVYATAATVKSAEDMEATLYRFSELTEKWASKILDGDEEAFSLLERSRQREADEAPARAIIRDCIVTAWHLEDYKKVSSLSKAMRPFLTPRELERWDWSEKYLLEGGPGAHP
jgi:hypothetical protein